MNTKLQVFAALFLLELIWLSMLLFLFEAFYIMVLLSCYHIYAKSKRDLCLHVFVCLYVGVLSSYPTIRTVLTLHGTGINVLAANVL